VTGTNGGMTATATAQATVSLAACDHTITSPQAPLSLRSPGTYCVKNTTIGGSVIAASGVSLYITGARVGGAIVASGPTAVTICGSTVDGAISVKSASGFVLIGDAGYNPGGALPACAANHIGGSVILSSNRAGFELGGNRIGGSGSIVGNRGSGPPPDHLSPEIEGNRVTGSLLCHGNVPAPVNGGAPNVIGGANTCHV
jgi:hypothetical protein